MKIKSVKLTSDDTTPITVGKNEYEYSAGLLVQQENDTVCIAYDDVPHVIKAMQNFLTEYEDENK